jgi:formate dehydrogenase subunit gamma
MHRPAGFILHASRIAVTIARACSMRRHCPMPGHAHPMTATTTSEPSALPDAAQLDALIAAHRDMPGALLPLLHAVQQAWGHVPDAAVPAIAGALQLSRAEVHGVLTYYHHFRRQPAGRTVVQVCRAEACQACGAEALLAHAERTLGCARHTTRADGAVPLEPVYCLGLCAQSPAVQIGDRQHARMTPQRLDALLATLVAAPAEATP